MAYKAGNAYITVAPSFKGFQKTVGDEVKKMQGLSIPVNVDLDTTKARAELDKLIRRRTLNVDVKVNDITKAEAEISDVTEDRDVKIDPKIDKAKLATVQAEMDLLGKRMQNALHQATSEFGDGLERKLGELRAEFQHFGDARASLGIGDEEARAAIADFNRRLRDIAAQHPTVSIDVEADTAKAKAELDEATRNRETEVKVDLDDKEAEARLKLFDHTRYITFKARIDNNSIIGAITTLQRKLNVSQFFSQAGGLRLLAALSPALLPPLIGGVGAAGGALLAGGGLAGAFGLGAVSEITQVIAAHSKLQQVRESALSTTHEAAAAESSLISAEEGVKNAQIAVTDAQIALNDARRAAIQTLQDLSDTLKAASLAESGSKLAVKQALVELRAVQDNPQATRLQIEQALQGLREARLTADQAHTANVRAQQDAARTRREGVSGNEQVRSAAERLAAAQQNVADAQRAVAVAQTAKANADTRAAIAQRQLARVQKTLDTGPAKALESALKGVAIAWRQIGRATAGATVPVIVTFLRSIQQFLPAMAPLIRAGARALLPLVQMFGNFFNQSPLMKSVFKTITDFGPAILRAFGRGVLNIIRGLLILFQAFVPSGKLMTQGFLGITQAFVKWSREFTRSKGFQSFVAYMVAYGPKLLRILGDFVVLLGKFMIALAPVATLLVNALVPALDWLSKQNPTFVLLFAAALGTVIDPLTGIVLGLAFLVNLWEDGGRTGRIIVGTVLALGAAIAVFASGLSIATIAMAAFNLVMDTNPVLLLTLAVAALITAIVVGFILLYRNSTTFRNYIDAILSNLAESFKTLWGGIKDFGGGIIDVFKGVYHFFHGLFTGDWKEMWGGVLTFLEGVGKTMLALLKWPWTEFKAFMEAIGLGDVFDKLWTGLEDATKAAVNFLVDALNKVIEAINWLTHWVGIPPIHPIGHWGGSGSSSASIANAPPPSFGLGTQTGVGGGIVNAPPPGFGRGTQFGFAQGGVLPGYSPGYDVHHFYSPTAGRLDLSGGEGILVPQAARMLGGPHGIAAINRRARGFAGGGVWRPVAGGTITQGLHDVWTGYPAIDFGVPIGSRVAAVAPGRVSASYDIPGAGNDGYASYGRVMRVLHEGFESLYAHLSERGYGVGQQVFGGQVIGFSGDTGNATGPHLHFGVSGRSPYDFVNGSTDYRMVNIQQGGTGLSDIASGIAGGAAHAYEIARHAFSWLWGKFTGAFHGTSPLAGLLESLGHKAVFAAAGKVKDVIGSVASGALTTVGGLAHAPSVPLLAYQSFARSLFGQYGWNPDTQFGPLNLLWQRESGWNPLAVNPSSGAYGIPQALPGSKMSGFGLDWRTNPYTQMRWGESYIHDRYGTPSAAWAHEIASGWYDNGGVAYGSGWMPKNIVAPERVLGPSSTRALDDALRSLGTAKSNKPQRIVLDVGSGRTLTGYMVDIADASVAANGRWQYGNGVAR